jgi:hypothetical protein
MKRLRFTCLRCRRRFPHLPPIWAYLRFCEECLDALLPPKRESNE